jgi:serine/threonine protein kinase
VMGSVYVANHPSRQRDVAIKVLRPELISDRTLVARFFEEARTASATRHQGIIDVLDTGTLPDSDAPYVITELLEGSSLAARLAGGASLVVEEAVEVGCQIAAALSAAHGQGLVHRNLKPENIFLIPDELHPAGVRVKVTDFGIATLRTAELRGAATRTFEGAPLVAPAYLSPEQCRGVHEEIDRRADIYSLGILLYQMVCGAPPFTGANHAEVMMMHLSQAPAPPRIRNPQLPVRLEGTILRALVKRREDRFPSMVELEAALRRSIGVLQAPSRRSTLRRRVEAGLDPPRPSLIITAVDLPVVTAPPPKDGPSSGEAATAAAIRRRRNLILGAAAVGALVGALAVALAVR